MKGKFWGVLWALALMFSLGLVAAGSIAAEGATLYVSTAGTDVEACGTEASPCRTIQYTINKASAGDTLNVAAGTYSTSGGEIFPITIDKALTLKGAQFNVDPSAEENRTDESRESIIDATGIAADSKAVYITAGGATFDGFTVKNATTASAAVIVGNPNSDHTTITTDHVTISNNILTASKRGLAIYDNRESLVKNNRIVDNADIAIYVAAVESSTTIDGNLISGNHSAGAYGAITVTNGDAYPATQPTIINNSISNNGAIGIKVHRASAIIRGNIVTAHSWNGIYAYDQVVRAPATIVEDNTVTNNGSVDPGQPVGGIVIIEAQSGPLDNEIIIRGNTISGNNPSGITLSNSEAYPNIFIENNLIISNVQDGIWFWNNYEKPNVTVSGNTITGNGRNGILIDTPTASGYECKPTIHFNNIYGNTSNGIENKDSTVTIDATNNWWGSINGPTYVDNTLNVGNQGDAVTGLVNFTPWLDAASPAGVSFAPVTNGANGYASIQSAIDAASAGDTLNVAAGTYTEQILIQKPLTLVGAGKGSTIIQAPETRSGTVSQGSTWDYIVAAYPTSGTIAIRIQGFTIDANNQPKTAGTAGLIGVFFRDVKGEQAGSYSCAIQGFEQVEYQSWGIRVYGDSALSIDDNTLTGYTRDGITVKGDGAAEADPVVTINNNDLTGSALPLNGISVGDGATGIINGNTVRDHTRSAEWGAVGIIVGNSDNVQVTDNTISNCFYGIYLDEAGSCSVSGNTLTDNIKRAISLDTASNNTVSSNIINGPAAGTDDTAIGLDNNCANNTIGGGSLADGNTITMATSGTGNLYAIYMQASVGASANLISNNTITGGTRAVQFDGPPGITGITTISNNVISGQSFGGIVANNNGSLVITGNSLTDTTRPMEFWGPVDVTITDNIIDGAAYDGINLGNVSGAKNISGNTIRNCPENFSAIHGQPDADNLIIENNIISTSYTGIRIENGCTGVSIINNIISNNSFSGISTYDALLTVTGNTIDQSYRGIETNADLTAHNNAFTNNEYGSVMFYADGIRDITNNWWGSVNGPAAYLRNVDINTFNQGLQGDYIQANDYANFTFTPWLDAAPPAGVSFAPVTNGANGYASIQSAIDAATAGDTINVAAGTYNELVTINKAKLTLKAEAPGQAIIKPSAERVAWPYGAVLITKDGVTVDGFEVDGTNVLNNGINAYGVSGVTIKNNLVHGTTAAWEGVGIIVWDWDASKTVDNATIANNTVYDTGRMGILVMDYGVSGYDVTEGHVISGNIVHDTWQKGVEWGDGGGGIQINAGKNCSITDNKVYNTQNGDWGIYMFGSASGNQITNNTIRDNPIGLGLWISGLPDGETINWGSDAAASPGVHFNNIYSNTTFGAASYGDQVADRIDATDNWWGTSVGTAIAAMVSGNVDYDPWIGVAAEEVASDTLSDGEVVALPSSEVTATLSSSGTAAVTLAKYADNPVEAEGGVIGSGTAFYDVQVTGSTDAAATLSVVLSGATPGDVAWYYAGSAWRPVKDNDGATPLADADGLLTIVFGPDSTPKLSELTGTPIVADGEALAVQFASDTAIVGQAITAQVVAKSTNLHGVEVQLTFDASKLEVKSLVLGGDLLAQQVDQNTYDNAAGTITFAYSQASLTPAQVGDDILLATITFTPKATAASTAVGINTATLSDPDGTPLGVYPTTLEYVDTEASVTIGNMITYLTLVF